MLAWSVVHGPWSMVLLYILLLHLAHKEITISSFSFTDTSYFIVSSDTLNANSSAIVRIIVVTNKIVISIIAARCAGVFHVNVDITSIITSVTQTSEGKWW